MRLFFRIAVCAFTCFGLLTAVVCFTPIVAVLESKLPLDWYDGDADVLVILGGSMLVDGTGPRAALGFDSYLRCTYAAWEMRRHRYGCVVVTGYNGLAQAMARYLAGYGATPACLLLEDSARTTFENAEFTKNLLQAQTRIPAHPKIVVLTSDYHCLRAKDVFEKSGLQVRTAPVPDVAKRAQSVRTRWGAFLDLGEEMGKLVFYKLTGKI